MGIEFVFHDKYEEFEGNLIEVIPDIETIKTYDGYTITSAKLNVIKEQVANWLTSDGRNYGSVNDAITNKDENLSQLIQIYTDAGNWTAPTP